MYGDTCIYTDEYAYIHKNVKLDHGVWIREIEIGDNTYLLSSTLEKMPVG